MSLIMMEHDNVIAQRDSLALLAFVLDGNLGRDAALALCRVGVDLGIVIAECDPEDGTFYRFAPGLLADIEEGRKRIFARYRMDKH